MQNPPPLAARNVALIIAWLALGAWLASGAAAPVVAQAAQAQSTQAQSVQAQSVQAQSADVPSPRTIVRTAADMPALTFALARKPSQLVVDPAALRPLAEAVHQQAARILETHDFVDPAGRNIFREAQANAALILGRPAETLRLQVAIGADSGKAEERLTAGLTTRAIIAAHSP